MGTNLHNLPDGIHEVKSWFFQMVTQIIKCSQCRNLSIIFVTHSLPTFCYSAALLAYGNGLFNLLLANRVVDGSFHVR